MISLRQRLQSLPLLFSGICVGLLLMLISRISGGVQFMMTLLMLALPFLLAALTGIAKTTTV